jgi:hypothetical protein
MRLSDALAGVGLLGFDTAPFIYYVEEHPRYILLLDEVFALSDKLEIRNVTSVVSLCEVLV